jgi:hypothetical protein
MCGLEVVPPEIAEAFPGGLQLPADGGFVVRRAVGCEDAVHEARGEIGAECRPAARAVIAPLDIGPLQEGSVLVLAGPV